MLRLPSASLLLTLGLQGLCSLVSTQSLAAQCATQWLPGSGHNGVDGGVSSSTLWDPDGPGPASERIVFLGDFSIAGSVFANDCAVFDPASGTWSALGGGPTLVGGATAIAASANGDLVACGGAAVYRWSGSTWLSLGTVAPLSSARVFALAFLPNGDLVAAGDFTSVGGVSASCIARWNGAAWTSLGSGLNGVVNDLAIAANGDVLACGAFSSAGAVGVDRIARWNGSAWSAVGSGLTWNNTNKPTRLLVRGNGEIVIGGPGIQCTVPTGLAHEIVRWDGASWAGLLPGYIPVNVRDMAEMPNGDLLVSGDWFGHLTIRFLGRWDGSSWTNLAPELESPPDTLVVLPSGSVVAAGGFRFTGSSNSCCLYDARTHLDRVAVWDGIAWKPLGSGMNEEVFVLTRLANGDLLAGGAFNVTPGGVSAPKIARWNGVTWAPLGSGLGRTSSLGASDAVRAIAVMPYGDIVAGGSFRYLPPSGLEANRLARWNGTTWSQIGPVGATQGVNGDVNALAVLNGDLVVGGAFSSAGGVAVGKIARWDGAAFSPIGGSASSTVWALATHPNGDLIAGGAFTSVGGVSANRVARWNGSAWAPLGAGVAGTVYCLAVLPNGDIVVGGSFTSAGGSPANNVARWDGTNWSPLGLGLDGRANALHVLPNGDLVAGGTFTSVEDFTVPASRVARWDGTAWSAIGSGVSGTVNTLVALVNDDVMAGGDFLAAGGAVSAYLGRLTTTCPAVAASYGAGIPSSGGSNLLSTTSLPWVESTFRATGTGLPSLAFVLAVTSVNPVVPPLPLAVALPQAVPGADLLVAPDIVEALFTATGVAQSQLFLPNTPPLVGVTFYHQMIPIEIDAQLNFLAITATNALQVTTGMF